MRIVALLVASASLAVSASSTPPNRLPHPLPHRTLNVPILMYHRVGRLPAVHSAIGDALTVQPGVFDAQMKWLVRHGFHAVSSLQLFDALEWGRRLPPRPIMVTFDDGYRDVLYRAAPILHRLGLPATAFVITDRVSGRDPSFLTWRELRNLERAGFAIGSHTVHHLTLTAVSSEQAWLELSQSRDVLQDHLHAPIDWFAYPRGATDPLIERLVRKAGYLAALTERPGFLQSAREPFRLHRDEILRADGLAGFAALLHSEA